VVLLLVGLWRLDRCATDDGRIGWERNAVRGALRRLAEGSAAEGVLLLGSSTTRDFLTPAALAAAFDEPESAVLDGHVNGCHQDCTWAEVRRLRAEGRHVRVAVYGLNQFQMCDDGNSKRILQQRLLLPPREVPGLAPRLLGADRPARALGRFLAGQVSTVFADTAAVRERLRDAVLGVPVGGRSHRWAVPRAAPPQRVRWCPYGPGEVAYKLGWLEAMLDDLDELADATYVILLPDESLDAGDPAIQAAWQRHRETMARLVAAHPRARLLDLTVDGPWPASRFRDGMHLERSQWRRQQRALHRAVRAARGVAAP
jgi:hypothetical protein